MRVPSSVRVLLSCGIGVIVLAPSALAQSSASSEAEYHNLLESIASAKTVLAQNQIYVAAQEKKIASMHKQLAGVGDLTTAMEPMVGKMLTNIDAQIHSDFPFLYDKRIARLEAFRKTVKDDKASIVDKYRKALAIYKFEVNYGMSMESVKGNHPVHPVMDKCKGDDCFEKDKDGKVKIDKATGLPIRKYDGRYLRYGRLAYVYMDNDGVSALRYDLSKKKWVNVPKSQVTPIRRAVRIASGEAAPAVVMVPVSPSP